MTKLIQWYSSRGHTKYGRSIEKKLEKETVRSRVAYAVSFFIRYRILVVGEKPLFKQENYGIVIT